MAHLTTNVLPMPKTHHQETRHSRVARHWFVFFVIALMSSCTPLAKTGTNWHRKYDWKAGDYFEDSQVVQLCESIEENDLEAVNRLIEAGANVNAIGKGNMTPLMWAYPDNKRERFEQILKAGADPNVIFTSDFGTGSASIKGASVTHLAAASTFPQHFDLVFEYGGDPNLRQEWGQPSSESPRHVLRSPCSLFFLNSLHFAA